VNVLFLGGIGVQVFTGGVGVHVFGGVGIVVLQVGGVG
jgi:hypothetical protein